LGRKKHLHSLVGIVGIVIYLFENKDALEKVQSRFRKKERERERERE
jgi:hypothetical protein